MRAGALKGEKGFKKILLPEGEAVGKSKHTMRKLVRR
jgi:hypothetical protein